MPTERLYGVPGAEVMYVTPQMVYESEIEPWDSDELPEKAEIEEWDVHSPRHHMPTGTMLLEWVTEWAEENGEVGEDYDLADVVKLDAVKHSVEFLLDIIANKVNWRMAKDKLASHWVTWDEDGKPLLDGEPMYVQQNDGEATP